MTTKRSIQKPLKIQEFDISKIIFGKLDDNKRVTSQKLSYIRYRYPDGEGQLQLQTCEISNEVYGIPREGPYYPDAKSRSYYRLGFCHDRKQHDINYDDIEKLYNILLSIDEYCDSDEFRNKMFGDKSKDYEYQPLVRIPEVDEADLDKDGKPKYKPPYTKLKLDLEWSPDLDTQTTKPLITMFNLVDGKRVPVKLETFDDLTENIPYLSKLKFVISFSKLYAMKQKSGSQKNAKKSYGITLKATHVVVDKPLTRRNKQQSNIDPFDDDDEEEKPSSSSKITRVKHEPEKVELEDDDVEEDEEIEDDDEVIEEKPK